MRVITVAFYQRQMARQDWDYPVEEDRLTEFFTDLNAELSRFDIQVHYLFDDSVSLEIRGYGDLLNSIRIRATEAGLGNVCLGHVIGASQRRDLFEDIRRGVNRTAFAPETIEPEGSDKIVCHNCGCGC